MPKYFAWFHFALNAFYGKCVFFVLNLVFICKSLKTYENNKKMFVLEGKKMKNYYVTKRYTVKILSNMCIIELRTISFYYYLIVSNVTCGKRREVVALSVHNDNDQRSYGRILTFYSLLSFVCLKLNCFDHFFFLFICMMFFVFKCDEMGGVGVFHSKKFEFLFLCSLACQYPN